MLVFTMVSVLLAGGVATSQDTEGGGGVFSMAAAYRDYYEDLIHLRHTLQCAEVWVSHRMQVIRTASAVLEANGLGEPDPGHSVR